MATVSTRLLFGKDRYDRARISVEAKDYLPAPNEGKWGIIKVKINSVSWGTSAQAGDYGKITLQVPRHEDHNDTKLLDEYALGNSQGSITFPYQSRNGYVFAVNNGVFSPACFVQPDGTVDLLHLIYRQNPELEVASPGISVTVDYTITFTDLTPTAPPDTGLSSADLKVSKNEPMDSFLITQAQSGLGSGDCGYLTLALAKLVTSTKDEVEDDMDSVPLLTVESPGRVILAQHPVGKWSGTKLYQKEFFCVHAFNYGKLDGNAPAQQGTPGDLALMIASLAKQAEWPCDDTTTATLYWKKSSATTVTF